MAEPVEIAEQAARDAGALLKERFRTPARGIETKSTATDMVSDADRDAEALIVERIRRARPDDAIFGEEGGLRSGPSGFEWVIDPLDGTTNFLRGIDQWCVSIACTDAAGGCAAVVYDPSRDELFRAWRGGGAWLNGAAIRVSLLEDLSRAVCATGYSYVPEEREAWAASVRTIAGKTGNLRRFGSAALDLAWTAAGRFDVYAEVPCRRWDRAAGELLVTEAGGSVSLLPALGPSGEGVLAGPPALHAALAAVLSTG